MKARGPLPIRWRLTSWYALSILLGFVLLAAGLYAGLRLVLLDSFDEQLTTQTELVISAIDLSGANPALDPVGQSALVSDDRFVRLFDSAGTLVLDTSTEIGAIAIDDRAVSRALTGASSSRDIRIGGNGFQVRTKPLTGDAGIVGVVQVGSSRDDIDETLRLLLIMLAIAAPIVIAGATMGGYVIAGRALTPIAAITDLAANIEASDLSSRIELPLPNDEIGRLAKTFNTMLARIEQGFDRQKRFTGDAAHELRTPLAMMRGEIDLALRQPRSASEYRQALEALDGDLQRVTGLTGSLLTLARSDDGRLAPERVNFDLAQTLDSLLQQYRPIADEAKIELRANAASIEVLADEDQIIQVLVNLLDNALAHTPPGGWIEVGARSDSAQTHVWVRDSGAGIPAADLPKVFDRFYRVDRGRTRQSGGAGLGLSIARVIVEAHGGSISISSEVGRGTTVEFVLPSQESVA